MASTPRAHRYQLPLATRSTDVAELAKCPGSWLLKHVHESEQQEATFFELGSSLHMGIEHTIKEDLDLDQALALVTGRIEDWIGDLVSQPIETSSRGVDTIIDDAETLLKNWFRWTHPDSLKRHPAYEGLSWPPAVELPWQRTTRQGHIAWGSIDAVFDGPGGVVLVDWKSGTSKMRDSDQLHFYTYGYGSDLVSDAWYHHLARKQERSVVQQADEYPGDRVIERRIKNAVSMKETIINEGRVEFRPDWYCSWCPVRAFCPKEGDNPDNMAQLRRSLRLVRPMHGAAA